MIKNECEEHHGKERDMDEPCEWCEIESLRSEVEELESEVEALESALEQALNMRREIIDLVIAGKSCHIITLDQIAKAWNYLRSLSNPIVEQAYERALFKLNIHRCEECGGSGDVYYGDPQHGHAMRKTCSACKGNKWKVVSDDS